MKTTRVAWTTAAGTLGLLLAVGVLVLFTGAYNVAATEPHTGAMRWALNTLQRSSVGARAEPLEASLPEDSAALEHGLEHFAAMCVVCHGAPGVERGEFGRGMRPTPPALSEVAPTWTDAELFWIVKHGIRLAGMPAFGPTHSDEEIRQIAAFVRRLPEMTPDEYETRAAAIASGSGEETQTGDGHDHTH